VLLLSVFSSLLLQLIYRLIPSLTISCDRLLTIASQLRFPVSFPLFLLRELVLLVLLVDFALVVDVYSDSRVSLSRDLILPTILGQRTYGDHPPSELARSSS